MDGHQPMTLGIRQVLVRKMSAFQKSVEKRSLRKGSTGDGAVFFSCRVPARESCPGFCLELVRVGRQGSEQAVVSGGGGEGQRHGWGEGSGIQ